jgi:hypothetical protein
MIRIDTLERRIRQLEGFSVRVLWPDGTDVRSDYVGAKSYRCIRAARDNWTVARWVRERFNRLNPQFDVEVLDSNGNPVHGRTSLRTVRIWRQ